MRKVLAAYFGGSELELSSASIAECLNIADFLELNGLKQNCAHYMRLHMLESPHALTAYLLASCHSLHKVADRAKKILRRDLQNAKAVVLLGRIAALDDDALHAVLPACYDVEFKEPRRLWRPVVQKGTRCDAEKGEVSSTINVDNDAVSNGDAIPMASGELVVRVLYTGLRRMRRSVDSVRMWDCMNWGDGKLRDIQVDDEIAVGVVDFILSGELPDIEDERLVSYLSAAANMGVGIRFTAALEEALKAQMMAEKSVCRCHQLAKKYFLNDVASAAYSYIRDRFEAVMQHNIASFQLLDRSTMLALLSDKDLSVSSEVVLLEWYTQLKDNAGDGMEISLQDVIDCLMPRGLCKSDLQVLRGHDAVKEKPQALGYLLDRLFDVMLDNTTALHAAATGSTPRGGARRMTAKYNMKNIHHECFLLLFFMNWS